jgi:hypothetical protein
MVLPTSVIPAIMVVFMHRDKYREASREGKDGQGDDKGGEDIFHDGSRWSRYTQIT